MEAIIPSSENYVRDYKQEYKTQHASKAAKKKRASRNAARAIMEKAGRVRKGDGKDVDHKNTNANDNSKGNLRVQSASKNRSYPRNKNAGKK
jgi:hypothetical protein